MPSSSKKTISEISLKITILASLEISFAKAENEQNKESNNSDFILTP
jgi:hypothetical protein